MNEAERIAFKKANNEGFRRYYLKRKNNMKNKDSSLIVDNISQTLHQYYVNT